jgi:enoyl-CoA hydratase/carnithine racemase
VAHGLYRFDIDSMSADRPVNSAFSPSRHLLSVAMTKLTVNPLAHALDDLASHMDVDQFTLASMSEDYKEGVAAFLERRKPRFRGR